MKTSKNLTLSMSLALLFIASTALAWNPNAEEKAQRTIEAFKEKASKFEDYFTDSYGYAVFPSIGKAGFVVGGAHGKGVVYEQGEYIGKTKMTQVTLGFQWGGQAYSEVIFFENVEALESFINNKMEISGQASAVAANKGASADLAYENGVAIFTQAQGGLMYEATLGGQKFKFFPNPEPEVHHPSEIR